MPIERRFWTLSVWEDEGTLREFAFGGVHKETMLTIRADIGETRSTRWQVYGRDLPPTWAEAVARQDANTAQ